MPRNHGFGQTEQQPYLPDFVFEQLTERLKDLEVELLRQSTNIVVRLDRSRWALEGDAFDHIRIKRSLRQKMRALTEFFGNLAGRGVEHLYVCITDVLPLGLWIFYPCEQVVEEVSGVYVFQMDLIV